MIPFIIAAVSADGFIAQREDQGAYWTSKSDKKRFVELTKRAGVVVMGRTTFQTLPKPLKDRVNIVYTRSSEIKVDGVEVTSENPVDLINRLESKGFKELAICGGSQIYTIFMKTGLVKKLYLTIEPVIFGSGVKLFKEELNYNLKLVSNHITDDGSILLEYDVVSPNST